MIPLGMPTVLAPGLVVRQTPSLPRGHQIRCTVCCCTVSTSHVPNSTDCQDALEERERSIAS